jgi:hypothetical protein
VLGWSDPTFGHGSVPKVNHANFPLGQIVLISSGIGG